MAGKSKSEHLLHRIQEVIRQQNQLNPKWEIELRKVDHSMVYATSAAKLMNRRTFYVASSRLGHKLDNVPRFFGSLLTFALQLDKDKDVLLTSDGTTCDKFVRRIGELFEIPVVLVKYSPRCENQASLGCSVEFEEQNQSAIFDLESRGVDFALSSIASVVVALSVRKNGNLHSAISKRLLTDGQTRILVEPTLTASKLTHDMLSNGATGWFLFGGTGSKDEASPSPVESHSRNAINSDEFLLHWTRRRVGPWPDQTEDDFIDDLLFQGTQKDHGEVAALRRIVATNRILATNELTRDSRPVVCFSDISFEELLDRRVFRSHLSRWDFEPFGIAIRKDWLIRNGGQKVVYGDNSLWKKMSPNERPFFQANGGGNVDWSHEKEWRIVGDVDLRRVPVEDAVVFVPSEKDASEVQGFSRWPIVVLSR